MKDLIGVWDATTGKNLLTLPVDREGTGGVSFSPVGAMSIRPVKGKESASNQ